MTKLRKLLKIIMLKINDQWFNVLLYINRETFKKFRTYSLYQLKKCHAEFSCNWNVNLFMWRPETKLRILLVQN